MAITNDRAFWQRTIGDGKFDDGDLATAQAILSHYDTINRSITVAGDYAKAANAALAGLSSPVVSSSNDDRAMLIDALGAAARFSAARQN